MSTPVVNVSLQTTPTLDHSESTSSDSFPTSLVYNLIFLFVYRLIYPLAVELCCTLLTSPNLCCRGTDKSILPFLNVLQHLSKECIFRVLVEDLRAIKFRGKGAEGKRFIIRQPPIGEKDDYDSENSWISDRLPSSSRSRRRGEERREGGEWREKWSASGVDVGVDSAKSEIKVERRCDPG